MIRRKRSNIEDYLRSIAAEWNGGGANFGDPFDMPDDVHYEDVVSEGEGESEAEAPPVVQPQPARQPRTVQKPASGGAGRAPTTPVSRFVTPSGTTPASSAKKAQSPGEKKLELYNKKAEAEKLAAKEADAKKREQLSKTPDGHRRLRELSDGRIIYAGPKGGEYVLSADGKMQFISQMTAAKRKDLEAAK